MQDVTGRGGRKEPAPTGYVRKQPMRAVLKLYLVGGTPPSERALASLPALRAALGETGDVQVVDLSERPEVAEAERILATPLLVREEPLPVRRIAGDLSDAERVVWTLGLGRRAS